MRFKLLNISNIFENKNFDENIINLYQKIKNIGLDKSESELTYIYFIREYKIIKIYESVKYTKNIKIGHAKNPIARLKEFQTGNSNELHIDICVRSIPEAEKIIHNFFVEDNIRGEWFYESTKLKEFLDLLHEKDHDFSFQKLNR